MNPLAEKANTLSRCGSFYYRTLVDDSKADAEFVSHTHSYARLMPLGDKIATAIKGGCYYEDYYKIIKFTDRDIDWNGVKQALQYRVRGGIGNITSELEYVSSSKARELGTSAWVLLKEDVPTGLINVASIRMQTLSIAPIEAPIFLQVYIIDPEGTAIHLATSTQSVTLAAGEFGEWSFDEALIGTDIYNQNSQIAFQFTTKANATWQDADYILTHLAVGAGSYVPSVQFYKLAAAPALPSFNRPSQLTIRDHFLMGDDKWNWISKEGTPQPIAFPGGEKNIELPETQELIWDLYIDEHIMVTSIKMDNGTMLYANQDFASQFGKLTFLKNPIALFPKMQFMAQSYTGRMPNLYNYLVRADEVYGSVGKMMNYMRGSQSIKSLYHASAQAAGMAVIDKDCTVVAVSPLLEGKLYITTAGRYEANYPHTPLKPGTKLPKDYIIGGNQLYRLIGPYDPMPSNITGINLDTALPVPGLVAPNEEITITDENGNYRPGYAGAESALKAYHTYIDAQQKQIQEPNKRENGMQHFRYTACPNRCVVACINESYMTSQMKLRLMTYLQRELPIGSVLVTANLPNRVNEFQSLIDGTEFVLEELRAGLNKLVGEGNYELAFDNDKQELTIACWQDAYEAIADLVSRVVPENLDIKYDIDFIPARYTRLEYLEVSGTQWINTGLPIRRLSFSATVELWGTSTRVIAGVYQNNPYDEHFQTFYEKNAIHFNVNDLSTGVKSSIKLQTVSERAIYKTAIDLRTKKIEIADLTNDRQVQATLSGEWIFTHEKPVLTLFIRNNPRGNVSLQTGSFRLSNARCYAFAANYNGENVADYVPALDPDGVPCMYDRVTKKPFYNSGTGTFGYAIKEETVPASGVYARLINGVLDVIADTEDIAAMPMTLDLEDEVTPFMHFADVVETMEHYGISPEIEEQLLTEEGTEQ